MINSMSTENSPPVRPLATNQALVSRQKNASFQAPMFGLSIVSFILFIVLLRLGVVLLSIKGIAPVGLSANDSMMKLVTIFFSTIGNILATGAVTIFLHEMLHALISLAYGHWPRFGRGKFEYVGAVCDGRLTPNQAAFISLAPLFILSLVIMPLLLVPTLKFFALIALAGNIAGSLDDVWLAYRVWEV